MSPALINSQAPDSSTPGLKPTSILHRTPWRPPVAKSAEGSYVTLDDGRILLDAVGGAAVACIGNGHPEVVKAIKDQVDKVSCMWLSLSIFIRRRLISIQMSIICSCQTSPQKNLRSS